VSKALVCDGASHENDFGLDVALRQLQFVWIEAMSSDMPNNMSRAYSAVAAGESSVSLGGI
jgi:hypothetical protein